MVEEVLGRVARQTRATVLAIFAVSLAACLNAPESSGDGDGDGPVQLLANPSFEEGGTGWDREGSVEIATTDALSLPPSAAGSRVALLGRGDGDYDSVEQTVTVPPWTRVLEVSGVQCFTTVEDEEYVFDEFWIYIESADDGEDVVEASNLDASVAPCTWTSFELTPASYAGEQIRFVLEVSMDENGETLFAVDDLALTAYP